MKIPGMHYVGGFHTSGVTEYWRHLRAARPAWIVVVGAAQFSEARNFARAVQQDSSLPTNVIFRHWTAVQDSASDNGRMSQLTADQWMQRVGAQHIGEPYWLMPDNEGDGELNANAQADLIPLAVKAGLKLAIGAWATHHPARDKWAGYWRLYETMYKYPQAVIAAPHIYYSLKPSVENLDGFRLWADFFHALERRMQAPLPFPVVISEFARLRNPHGTYLDANEGWRMDGINDDAYAKELLSYANARVLVGQRDMAAAWEYVVFSYPDWGTRGSLGVTKRILDILEQPPVVAAITIQAGEDIVTETDPVLGPPIRARLALNMNLRAAAGTDAPVKASVTRNTLVIYWKPVTPIEKNGWQWVKLKNEANGDTGWCALVQPETAMFMPVEIPPPVPPELLPAQIPAEWQPVIMQYVKQEVNRQLRDALHGVAAYLTALAEHEPANASNMIVFSSELVKQQTEEKPA